MVTTRVLNETTLGLAALAARLKSNRRSGTYTPQAAFRWCTRGITLPNGEVVVLEHVRLGNKILTSWEAFERFVAAQSGPRRGTFVRTVRSPAKRERASKRDAAKMETVLN
jgi:hypothetical protein